MLARITLAICLALAPLYSASQNLHVALPSVTTLDYPTAHLEILTRTPFKPVKLPSADTTKMDFLKLWYGGLKDNPAIIIGRLREENGDQLFIDRNYDDDLSNDGPPVFFPNGQNDFAFEIVNRDDPKQKVTLMLLRKRNNCDLPDSIISKVMDERGNLTAKFAKGWTHGTDFKGDFGTFYWDDRLTLRRGTIKLGTRSFAIGLFDATNNGLFNDKGDLLIVDLYGTNKLNYNDKRGVFELNDVFTVSGANYKVSQFDKYGTWLNLEQVAKESTFYFLSAPDLPQSLTSEVYPFIVEPHVWQITAKSIEGDNVSLNSFRGKYLLLNFWGEWCEPCLEEIPILIRHSRSTDQPHVQFVSFLRTKHPEKVKEIVKDRGMEWPQLLLTSETEKRFKISGYPTNILISPDGRTCVQTMGVDDKFFGENLK